LEKRHSLTESKRHAKELGFEDKEEIPDSKLTISLNLPKFEWLFLTI